MLMNSQICERLPAWCGSGTRCQRPCLSDRSGMLWFARPGSEIDRRSMCSALLNHRAQRSLTMILALFGETEIRIFQDWASGFVPNFGTCDLKAKLKVINNEKVTLFWTLAGRSAAICKGLFELPVLNTFGRFQLESFNLKVSSDAEMQLCDSNRNDFKLLPTGDFNQIVRIVLKHRRKLPLFLKWKFSQTALMRLNCVLA